MTKNTKVGRKRDARTQTFNFSPPASADPGISSLDSYVNSAWDAFNELNLPTISEEAWRRTDLRKMPIGEFQLPGTSDLTGFGNLSDLAPVPEELLEGDYAGQIVLETRKIFDDNDVGQKNENSQTEAQTKPFGSRLSPELAEKGVIFTDFRTAQKEHFELLAKLIGTVVPAETDKFSALTAALAEDGVLLYVPRNVQIEKPLHSLLWGAGANLAHLSHLIIYLDEGASAIYIHESASPTEPADSMHAGIVEITLEDNANLRFVEIQSWGKHIWNFSHERAKIGRNANLDWIFGATGSKLTKNFSTLDIVGEGASSQMSGLFFADGDQHLDHDTQQDHHVAHTYSNLLFKGVLKGKSRSVWQGMIYVAPNAQQTDAYQSNKNLLLSKDARADSIPGLEILADDVRCSHGATVGKIDDAPLFYLLSRGIPKADAERLIVEGFFDPVLRRIPVEGVRERLERAIAEKLA